MLGLGYGARLHSFWYLTHKYFASTRKNNTTPVPCFHSKVQPMGQSHGKGRSFGLAKRLPRMNARVMRADMPRLRHLLGSLAKKVWGQQNSRINVTRRPSWSSWSSSSCIVCEEALLCRRRLHHWAALTRETRNIPKHHHPRKIAMIQGLSLLLRQPLAQNIDICNWHGFETSHGPRTGVQISHWAAEFNAQWFIPNSAENTWPQPIYAENKQSSKEFSILNDFDSNNQSKK